MSILISKETSCESSSPGKGRGLITNNDINRTYKSIKLFIKSIHIYGNTLSVTIKIQTETKIVFTKVYT